MKTENTIPKAGTVRNGTTANHIIDDINNDSNHTNAAAINMIIRIGSWAIENINMANGGPNAKKLQP